MPSFAISTATLATLGPNFQAWFAAQVVTATVAPLYSTPLPSPMTGAAIVATLGAQPVTLDIVASHVKSMSANNKHLFFIADASGIVRAVMAFRLAGKWQFVALATDDPCPWYSDPDDGTLLVYSSAPFSP